MTYRICHLAKYYPPMSGGIESHVQTLARAQAALGCKVKVICVNGCDRLGNPAPTTATIHHSDGPIQVLRLGRLWTLARWDVCPGFFRHLWQLFNEPWDVIHLHTPNPTMLLGWAMLWLVHWVCRRPIPPLVITHHSDIIRQRILKYALRPVEYLTYQQAASILTSSHFYIQGSRFLQAFAPNVQVLPLGIDRTAYTHPSPAALAYAEYLQQQGQPLWLAVGRLVYYKALPVAIAALAQVPGRLMIIGVGPLEAQLRHLADQWGVSDRIIWHGQATSDELIGAYHAATALWFPSNIRSEGFGLVQVEAMACGCPVINAAIPGSGVPWVSRHGQEGLTVPLNDADALAKAAWQLLENPELRQRLRQASRQRASEFDHDKMAWRSLEVYQTVLPDRPLAVPQPTLVRRGIG